MKKILNRINEVEFSLKKPSIKLTTWLWLVFFSILHWIKKYITWKLLRAQGIDHKNQQKDAGKIWVFCVLSLFSKFFKNIFFAFQVYSGYSFGYGFRQLIWEKNNYIGLNNFTYVLSTIILYIIQCNSIQKFFASVQVFSIPMFF